ncbi:DUF4168 domain-containing protein [Phormidium sp. CLA17]|nr:DUF4168 domain-containing protein [Leptolyngbya sp. Cla-17]
MNRSMYFPLRFSRPSMFKALLFGVSTVGLLFNGAAQAQSPADIAQYTAVARQIEQQRMLDFAEVKRLMAGNVPENVCQQGNIPSKVREICDRFDNNSRTILQKSGMSVSKFNEAIRFCQQNPKPKECPARPR